jgi:two-component system, OmpR family, phosphate regulon response regulator PhoB
MGETAASQPFRILLVEDEPVIRELVKNMLSDGNVVVETANNGVDGLKMARSQEFDLILLDVVLPQMDGITVCRLLKADVKTASVPLHMLTAKARKADVDAATRAGANGYIYKPFRGAELMDLVDALRKAKGG